MARTTSAPVVPRWYIGRNLRRLRDSHRMRLQDAAKIIGRSVDTVRRIEAGEVAVSKGDLTLFLDAYQASLKMRAELMELQESAQKRGWWVPYGPVPDASLALNLGVESAATGLRWYSHFSVPGFLQTTDYARALLAGTQPDADPAEVRQVAELRPIRYEKIFVDDPIDDAIVVLDETVLRRPVGDTAVMRAQLRRILDAPCTLRVVPLAAGPHPGVASFGIFDLDTENFGPVVYLEGVRDGQVILDDEKDVAVFQANYDRIEAVAMAPEESRDLVKGLATRRVRKS